MTTPVPLIDGNLTLESVDNAINLLNQAIATKGAGTVTSVSVAAANGFTGTVASGTTTPAITIVAGAITPSSVNGVSLSGSATPALAVTGTTTVSGANTGDQTTVSGNSGTTTAALGLKTASTTVAISSATAPTAGQVLTATSSTAADWETPTSGASPYITSIETHNAQTAPFAITIPANNLIVDTLLTNTTGNDLATLQAYQIPGYAGLASQLYVVEDSNEQGNGSVFTTTNVAGVYNNGASGVGATITTASATLTDDNSYSIQNGDYTLLTAQTLPEQNGWYNASGVGVAVVLTRATEYDQTAEILVGGVFNTAIGVFVQNTTGSIVVGTTPITFTVDIGTLGTTSPVTGATANALANTSHLTLGAQQGDVKTVAISFDPMNPITLYLFNNVKTLNWNSASINYRIRYRTV